MLGIAAASCFHSALDYTRAMTDRCAESRLFNPPDDVVIALRVTNRILAIDLMTGNWSDDPIWPDHSVVIPFKRER